MQVVGDRSTPGGIYVMTIFSRFGNVLFESSFDNNLGWGGDQLLSLKFSGICEIDLFLLQLTISAPSDVWLRSPCPRTTSRVLPKYYTVNPKFHLLN